MVECESLTTISVAPPSTTPSMAAFTSASRSTRPAAACGPSPTHCSQSTTPAVPSMSLDRKTFMAAPFPASCLLPGPRQAGPRGREGEVARRQVPRSLRGAGQLRVLLLTPLLGDRAPGAEPAPGRDAQRAGRIAGDRGRPGVGRANGQPRNGGEQGTGVRVPGVAEKLLGGRHLD